MQEVLSFIEQQLNKCVENYFLGKVDGIVLLTRVIIIIVIITFDVTVVPGHLHIHATLARINKHTLTHIYINRPKNEYYYQRQTLRK